MKTALSSWLLWLLVLSLAARAQPIRPAYFIPAGYRVLPHGKATGDLNGDGRPDVALALGPVAEDSTQAGDELPPRRLLVLWRTATGGYRLACRARQALLGPADGGSYGDPFEGLRIEKGVLVVSHYGGSSWRWTLTARFRYQQGAFYQIGDTYNLYHNVEEPCPNLAGDRRPGDEYRDMNLMTGQYERVKVSAQCTFVENQRGRQPVKPLVRLADYHPAP